MGDSVGYSQLKEAGLSPGGHAPSWCESYIGIPFVDLGRDRAGCDCWGLVRLVLAERARIELPSMATTRDDIETDEWTPVLPGQERLFDVVEMTTPMMTTTGWAFPALHAGIVVAFGWLLHTERATASILSRYHEYPAQRRVIGFWRHAKLAAKGH